MDHGAVPRLDLRGGDPAILAEPGIDHELLVIDDPLRRDEERLRDRDDEVGPRDRPVPGRLHRGRRLDRLYPAPAAAPRAQIARMRISSSDRWTSLANVP